MLPNSFDSIPEDKREAIQREATELYVAKMTAEAAKSDAQRKAEGVQAEINALAAQLDRARMVSPFGGQAQQLQKQLEEKYQVLEVLTGAQQDSYAERRGRQDAEITYLTNRGILQVKP